MRRNIGIALVAMVVCLLGTVAQAAYLYPWSATPTIPDTVDGAFTGGRDISAGVWYGRDATYHYFRIDVRDTPSVLGNNFAGAYGIYIDSIPAAGANHGQTEYLPTGTTGIDYIVDAHFHNSGTGTWEDRHFHSDWNGVGFAIGTVDGWQATENGGKSIEFKIARSRILGAGAVPADEFRIVAATIDVGSSAPTYDLAPEYGSSFLVPEPASLLLLGLGSLLIFRRR